MNVTVLDKAEVIKDLKNQAKALEVQGWTFGNQEAMDKANRIRLIVASMEGQSPSPNTPSTRASTGSKSKYRLQAKAT